MCVEGRKGSFGRVKDSKSAIIKHKVLKAIFIIGVGHEQRSLHVVNIPDATSNGNERLGHGCLARC